MSDEGQLAEAWRFYRREWRRVGAVTGLALLAVAGMTAAFLFTIGPFGIIPAAYLWFASLYWLQAPLTRLVEDARTGGEWRGARATMASIYPHLGRISGASALAALGVLGAMQLFPPLAFYLLARWALLVPVITVEDVGLFSAFSRSNEIVRGHAWRVFWRIALSGLILVGAVLAAAISAVVAGAFFEPEWAALALFGVFALGALVVVTPLIALTWTMTYYRLRAEVPRAVLEEKRLRGGLTLDRAWDVYRASPARLIALALPLALVLSAAQIVLARAFAILVVPATVVAYVWLEGLVAAGLDGHAPTRRAWLRDAWRRTALRSPALLVAAIVVAVTLPLVVGIRFVVAGAATVLEHSSGFGGLGRSWRLVRGQSRRAWKVVFITTLLVVVVLAGFAFLAVDLPLAAYAVVTAANVVTAPYVGVAWALMHRTLVRIETPQ